MNTLCSDAAELAANALMTELANFRIRSKHEAVEISGRVRSQGRAVFGGLDAEDGECSGGVAGDVADCFGDVGVSGEA